MYQIKRVSPFGNETVVVSRKGKRLFGASIQFVRWLHDTIPADELRPEQKALVDWYKKNRRRQPTTRNP